MSEEAKVVENAKVEEAPKTVDEMKAEFHEVHKENKIIEFVKNHKKAILVGVGAAIGTAVLATLANKAKKDEPELVADYKPEEDLDSTDEDTTEVNTEE